MTMKPVRPGSWNDWTFDPHPDWTTAEGQLLIRLAARMAEHPDLRETGLALFGSAPLQLGLALPITSRDIDIIPDQFHALLAHCCEAWGFNRGRPHLQICLPPLFRAGSCWRDRAAQFQCGSIAVSMAHPMDVVVGKLFRLSEKDSADIDALFEQLHRPDSGDFQSYCRQNTDIFSHGPPSFQFVSNMQTYYAYRAWDDPAWLEPLAESVRTLMEDEPRAVRSLRDDLTRWLDTSPPPAPGSDQTTAD